ncbi:MAG: hypothetical protein WA774_19355, partial [Candidatus Acidiferrales bacterium]
VQVLRVLQFPEAATSAEHSGGGSQPHVSYVALVVQQILLFRDLCPLLARVLVSFARQLGQFVNLCL